LGTKWEEDFGTWEGTQRAKTLTLTHVGLEITGKKGKKTALEDEKEI